MDNNLLLFYNRFHILNDFKTIGELILIYADHAATTKLSSYAQQKMLPYLNEYYQNPSSLYSAAATSRQAIAQARTVIANAIHAKTEEIFFTSGGTEADNWALKGIAFSQLANIHNASHLNSPPRNQIITTQIEHHAILNSCSFLEKLGFEIIYLPVNKEGFVSPEYLEKYITDKTLLVSIMYANNELGTIEPICALSSIAHRHGALFHTDAVQALGHIPVHVEDLGIDLLSASAHKFYGPKGCGFLFIRQGIPIFPLFHGGQQEAGKRAGTENPALIVGMAAALEESIQDMDHLTPHLHALTQHLLSRLKKAKLNFSMNGPSTSHLRLPGLLNLSFWEGDGEMLLHRLDLANIAVSTGAACNARNTELSHVLQAIHLPASYAYGTIRISLGKENTLAEIDRLADTLIQIIQSSSML